MKIDRNSLHKHVSFQLSQEISAICQPLKDNLNINYFFFQRDFCDIETEKQAFLAPLFNHAQAAEFSACDYVDTESVPMYLNCQANYYLNATHFPRWVAAMKENFNLHHFITKSEKVSENTWDRFCFATSSHDPKYLDFYLNNRDLLDSFISYFKEKSKNFIMLSNENRIYSGSSACIIENDVINNKDIFLKTVESKKSSLILFNGREVILPISEMKCLILLARGRSAKEIAQVLHISPRTVETYLLRAKSKLKCRTKKELLDILELNICIK